MQENSRQYLSKLTPATELKNIIRKLEENRKAAIWREKQPTFIVTSQGNVILYSPHYWQQGLIGWELQRHLFTLTPIHPKTKTFVGHIPNTGTTGNTTLLNLPKGGNKKDQ